jgi:hypothetical protein
MTNSYKQALPLAPNCSSNSTGEGTIPAENKERLPSKAEEESAEEELRAQTISHQM